MLRRLTLSFETMISSLTLRSAYRVVLFFFFSSRRRHTRCGRDWSSDVCSSDLFNAGKINAQELGAIEGRACPGGGACGGQFTANTMATAFEMLGVSPMGFNDV